MANVGDLLDALVRDMVDLNPGGGTAAILRAESEATAALYRERAVLAAALARLMGNAVVGIDPDEPEWPVLYIEGPTGQMSWHYSAADAEELLAGIPRTGERVWDGHTTDEKYRRLAAAMVKE